MDRFLGERILELLTSYNYKNLGLFTGKTGVCLALYSLAKGFDMAEAENAARHSCGRNGGRASKCEKHQL